MQLLPYTDGKLNQSLSIFLLQMKLCGTIALITLLFIIAWLPLFTLTMLATFDPKALPKPIIFSRLLHFVKWMHYSSSAINPFLYSHRNTDLRRTIAVILRRLVIRKGPGLNEVFRRRHSSLSTMPLRSLSITSDQSRKTSIESCQQSLPRAPSEFVSSYANIRRLGSLFEQKEKENVSAEGSNKL